MGSYIESSLFMLTHKFAFLEPKQLNKFKYNFTKILYKSALSEKELTKMLMENALKINSHKSELLKQFLI